MTDEELRDIVARASTMAERMTGDVVPVHSGAAAAQTRLARWRELVARGDRERFARRLCWDAIDEAGVHARLGDVAFAGERLPPWAALLREVLDDTRRGAVGEGSVCEPFVRAARRRLSERAGATLCHLASEALAAFEDALRRSLRFPAARCMDAPPSRPDLRARCTEYPVMARLLATLTLQWVDSTAELVARLDEDAHQIVEAFGGEACGVIAAVRPALSDAHDGGRTVCVLRFESGAHVVYKPRGLSPEAAFGHIVDWLREREPRCDLRALRVVDRGTHGWMEYAHDNEPTLSAERFPDRFGMALCLAHVLGGTDLHGENVVAAGEHPVILDLEALAHPRLTERALAGGDGLDAGGGAKLDESVLRTGLLPTLYLLPDGSAFAHGGFVTATSHPAGVLAGYRRMHAALVRRRRQLLADDSPLQSLREARTRVLLRPTSVYASLLRRSVSPSFQRYGIDRSIELDILKRPFLARRDRSALWPALHAEVRSLEQLDVPMFRTTASSVDLCTSCGDVRAATERSGFDGVLVRLRALDDGELARQSEYARIALTADALRRSHAERPVPADDAGGGEPLGAAQAMEEAAHVADALARLAHRGADGPTWSALTDGEAAGVAHGRRSLAEVGWGLAHGRSGIALFLGAWYAATGDLAWRDLAWNTLAPLRALLREAAPAELTAMGIGGARGAGGLVFALTRCATLLGCPELLEMASRAAVLVDGPAIRADDALDVFGGSAGAILGLLALHEAAGDGDALTRAAECGRHLLARRARDPRAAADSARAWRTATGGMAAGFAHGAAGIAHALERLHAVAGDPELLAAAMEARRFERTLYDRKARNWRTLPPLDGGGADSRQPLPCAWCHGAVGVGFDRVSSVAAAAPAGGEEDVALVLDAVCAADFAHPDHLCCGNMGRADLLLHAAARLGRPELATESLALAGRVVRRAHRRHTYGGGPLDAAFMPTLFYGLAGIGYEMLRLFRGDTLPSVLLLA